MNKRGEQRNYGVLIAAVVAIVAIVGLIILFNKGGASGNAVDVSDFEGVAAAEGASQEAGIRCGQCSASFQEAGAWDYKKCPLAPEMNEVSWRTPSRLAQQCCALECNQIGWKRCGDWCIQAADYAGFGYAAGTGGEGWNWN